MTADQLFTILFNVGVAVAVWATVLSLGLAFRPRDLAAPLRRVRLVAGLIVVNVVLIPGAAWLIATASPMPEAYVTGMVLTVIGSGSAASLKAAQLARSADLALALAVVVVLELVNIVAVPVWAGIVVGGASISGLEIVRSLIGLVLLPLLVGLGVRSRWPARASAWRALLPRAATVTLLLALASGIAVNAQVILAMAGSWVLVTAIVIVVVALGLGAAVGLLFGRGSADIQTSTLVSGFRFGALGLVIVGTQLGGAPEAVGPAITFALMTLAIPLVLALGIGRSVTRARSAQTA